MNVIDQRHNDGQTTEGDGCRFVTFLWSAALFCLAVLAVAAVQLTAPRDVLARSVPRDAVAYVHANGYGPAMAAIAAPALPASLSPDEVAVSWTVGADGVLRKAVLAAWHAQAPGPMDLAWLKSTNSHAHLIDDRVYLIGDEQSVNDALSARWTKTSFLDDKDKKRALGILRKLLPIQAYVEPTVFAAAVAPDLRDFLAIRPLVIGASVRADGSFWAVMTPFDRLLASGTSALLPPTGQSPSRKRANLPDSPLVFSVPGINLDQLSSLLNPDNKVKFTADFPDVSPDELAKSVSAYFGAIYPKIHQVELLDGSRYAEKVVDMDRFGFTRLVGSNDGIMTLRDQPTGISATLSPDGAGGSLLSNYPVSSSPITDDAALDLNRQEMCDKAISDKKNLYLSADANLLKNLNNQFINRQKRLNLVQFDTDTFIICGYPKK